MTTSPLFLPTATLSSDSTFPISLLRQYCFCPRIPYFQEVMQLQLAEKPWLKQGVDHHQRQAMLSRRRNLSRFGIDGDANLQSDVYIRSQKLGCHGIADMMLETESSIYLIEFKISELKPVKGHILQVAAYAIAAEEQFQKPVAGVYILYGDRGKTFEVQLSTQLRRQVEKTVSSISSLLNGASMPDSPASVEQCGQCEYLNFCADRDD